ncbi:MAG: multicopper oxidase domain-containing protein [Bacteroidota bacterium]|nr:multicopper oxidase domain-containing protein [Bacteroidota bacterium]
MRYVRSSLVGSSSLLLILVSIAPGVAQTPLPIPDTLSGSVIDLTMQEGTWEFHPGQPVMTFGYNGDLLGPTLILNKGQEVTLNVTNQLEELTTTHWHGLHVDPHNDGGPHSIITPGSTWSPSFTVLDRASTFWYHPHVHGMTDFQVSMGLAGMIIVRDQYEAALDLPRTYGVDDIPLILQAKAVVEDYIALHTGLDSIVLANGVRDAVADVPAQVVRLRCLNGASERTFFLGFSNGMNFHVIGTDGGLLSAPVTVDRLQLMPGERVELLVDLASMNGQQFQLMAYNSELPNGIIGSAQVGNGMTTLDGYDENALNGADFPLVTFNVVPATSDPVTNIPTALVATDPFTEGDATVTREFLFEPQEMTPMEMIEGPFLINGELFDMDVMNEVVELGATEIWSFTNNTQVGHPIHIHDIQFNILDRNGLPPQPWESGWKDVVFVPPMGTARVITRFDDFADPMTPYMFHCHLLMHEDEGMMGQFLVVDPTGISEQAGHPSLIIAPNPISDGTCRISGQKMQGLLKAEVIDGSGRVISSRQVFATENAFNLELGTLGTGTYLLRIGDGAGHITFGKMNVINN